MKHSLVLPLDRIVLLDQLILVLFVQIRLALQLLGVLQFLTQLGLE